MADTRCEPVYLAWLLAHDFRLAPFDSIMSELTDLGGDQFMVSIASIEDNTNLLIIYDQAWE